MVKRKKAKHILVVSDSLNTRLVEAMTQIMAPMPFVGPTNILFVVPCPKGGKSAEIEWGQKGSYKKVEVING